MLSKPHALLQRPVKPVASPLTPPQQQQLQQLNGEDRCKRTGSPASLGGLGGSRFGPSRVVTTPEQLQRYMVQNLLLHTLTQLFLMLQSMLPGPLPCQLHQV